MISQINRWPMKTMYNVVLQKNGGIEFISHRFGKGRAIIPIATLNTPPFLFTETFYKYNGNIENERRILCRVRLTKDYTQGQPVWQKRYCFGYLVDLLLEIKHDLHFDVDLYIMENEELGGYNTTVGNYTRGLFGDVITNKAMIGLGAVSITQKRMKFFDFTAPYMADEINIITLKELTEKNNESEFNLFTNLDHETQYMILALYIASILVLYVAENYLQLMKRIFTYDRRYLGITMFHYLSRDCILYITGLLVQRDLGAKCPTTLSGRLMSITFAFGMVCVTTLYTASLTYQQVIHGGYNEFKGLTDPRVKI